jgi:hypothetical protein
MPVFNGESLYTYILCKREGNAFSGIVSKDNGYITPLEKRRNFIIKVFDFAGNESHVAFAIEKSRDAVCDAAEGFVKVPASKSTAFSDISGRFSFTVPKGALTGDALMKIVTGKDCDAIKKIISAGIIKKEDASEVFSVHPFDQIYRGKTRISIKRPDFISKEEADNILVYHAFTNTAPAGLLTHYNRAKDSFEAETKTNGYFFLLRDRKPPFIQLPPYQDCITDDEPFRVLRFYFSDDLSGVNSKSIWLYIDGMKYPTLFDYDRGWIEAKLPKKAISNGIHHIFVRAKDRANNVAFLRSLLVF